MHNIKFIILTTLNVQFSGVIFTMLYNHHYYPFPELFIIQNRNSVPLKQLPIPLSTQHLFDLMSP